MRRAPTVLAAAIEPDQYSCQITRSVKRTLRESGVVVVDELLRPEGQHTLENAVSNTSSTNGTDNLALEIERVSSDLRDLPVTASRHLVSGNEVPDQQQHVHDDMFSDRGNIGSGDLEDLDLSFDGGLEVDVVRANTGGDANFKVLGLLEEVGGEVSGVEGCGNQHLGIDDVLLEEATGAFLVIADL